MTLNNTLRTCLVFLLSPFCLACINVAAQVVPAEQNYAMNAPGVARVQTVFSARVYVNRVRMNEARFAQLVDSVRRLDTTGSMLTAGQKLDMVVKALYRSPFRYFSASTEYLAQQHRIVSEGTGFFITGDGYLITNCHVIDRDSVFIRQKFILSTFQEATDANIRSLEAAWAMTLTDEQRNLLYNAYSLIYSQLSSMILVDLKKEIFLIYRADNDGGRPFNIKKPARLVIKGKPMPGKDVALLKLDNVSNLPTLRVCRDSVIRIGQRVLVYGYPEPATDNVFLAPESTSQPTLTSGIVSAVKTSVGGWPVIQMDANISHGSSGSPVCNDAGEVIGLATFGSLEQNSGNLASGYNFAIPVSVIREFIDSASVNEQISAATRSYNEALGYYFRNYYSRAGRIFQDVERLNNNYPELNYYQTVCEARARAGEDREPFFEKDYFPIMAAIVVFGLGMIIYRWRLSRRRGY